MSETYTARGYGRMLADGVRLDAYVRALDATVRPGSVVVDIGTGTGFFAIHAARLGARKVYAIDPSDSIAAAREAVRANGVEDRVELIQALSTAVDLPERADVIVSDLRGALPPFRGIVGTLADARARLLAPGGVLIPRRDTLFAAPVEAPETWADAVGPAEVRGVDLSAAVRRAANEMARGLLRPAQLLAGAGAWGEMDYLTRTDPSVCGTLAFDVARAGTAHGVAAWFDAELVDGIGFSSGPGHRTIYQTVVFPWPEPVQVAPGDRVHATIEARDLDGDYLWRWEARVERAERPPVSFSASTFHAVVPTPARLAKRAHTFRAALGVEGRIAAYVLGRMDGSASLGEIARGVLERFPGRFATWEAALTHVGALSEQYAG